MMTSENTRLFIGPLLRRVKKQIAREESGQATGSLWRDAPGRQGATHGLFSSHVSAVHMKCDGCIACGAYVDELSAGQKSSATALLADPAGPK